VSQETNWALAASTRRCKGSPPGVEALGELTALPSDLPSSSGRRFSPSPGKLGLMFVTTPSCHETLQRRDGWRILAAVFESTTLQVEVAGKMLAVAQWLIL
jgi:hypothetical protein